jgi:hypothetical protein
VARQMMLAALALGISTAAAAAAPKVLPGEWETTSRMVTQMMPNMPPQAARMMNERMGKPTVIRSCITPQQAARGPDTAPADRNCKVIRMEYAAGRMNSVMQCNDDGQMSRMKMSGTYTPTSYAMEGQMTGSGGSAGPMAMTMHVSARRLSPTCSAASK